MLKVGITGGIGSGKTTVCNIFRNLGVSIFSADEEGKKFLNEDETTKSQVIDTFGRDMYTSDGTIDRKRMAQLVFNSPVDLERLNGIIHPKVKKKFEEWAETRQNHPYVIKEAAILFETGYYQDLDKIVNVFAPKEQRIQRILKRDKSTIEDVERRMRFQYSDQERNELADYIILNEDKNHNKLLPQIMQLHEVLLNEYKQ